MSELLKEKLRNTIRDVRDFPKAGILFKDITPVFQDPLLCSEITITLSKSLSVFKPDAIAGIESRGFLFGILISHQLNIPFIPIRKAGKLPGEVFAQEYDLEYGSAKIEIPVHAIKKGMKVHIHDDLLATGGTAAAAHTLIHNAGGIPSGFSFLIELQDLNGRNLLEKKNQPILSLIRY